MKKIMVFTLIMLFAVANVSFAQKIRIGLALKDLMNPSIAEVAAGAKAQAAKYPNLELTIVSVEREQELPIQIRQIEDFIVMKMDFIGVFAMDGRGIVPTIEKVNRAGIPIATIDVDADGGKRAFYCSTDNYLGGKLGAEWIVKALNGKGRIAIMEGAPGSQANTLRCAGANEVFKKSPGIKIVTSLTANWRRDQGMKLMNDIITAHPNLDAVYGINDEMILGGLEALRARGMLKDRKMLMVGYNGAYEAIQQVYRGNLDADVVQFQANMGQLFVRWAMKVAQGEKLPPDLPMTPTKPPAPFIDSGVAVVDTKLLKIKVGPAFKEIADELEYYVEVGRRK